jgi:hypothetical protein
MTRGGVAESVSERVAGARRESTKVPRRGRKEGRQQVECVSVKEGQQQLECSLGAGAMPTFAIWSRGARSGELEGGGGFW